MSHFPLNDNVFSDKKKNTLFLPATTIESIILLDSFPGHQATVSTAFDQPAYDIPNKDDPVPSYEVPAFARSDDSEPPDTFYPASLCKFYQMATQPNTLAEGRELYLALCYVQELMTVFFVEHDNMPVHRLNNNEGDRRLFRQQLARVKSSLVRCLLRTSISFNSHIYTHHSHRNIIANFGMVALIVPNSPHFLWARSNTTSKSLHKT